MTLTLARVDSHGRLFKELLRRGPITSEWVHTPKHRGRLSVVSMRMLRRCLQRVGVRHKRLAAVAVVLSLAQREGAALSL